MFKANEEVGLVEIGFVKTVDILAMNTVAAEAAAEKGLVKLIIFPDALGDAEQLVAENDVELMLIEQWLGVASASVVIYSGM